MEWEIIMGIIALVMVLSTGINLGALLQRQYSTDKESNIFWIAYPTLVINLLGVVVILCLLIENIY